jgi:hypothetical protein
MAEREHAGRKLALAGGAGLAALLLLFRRKGWAFGTSGNGREGTTRGRRVVWVRADRIEVDGVAADLQMVIAMCRTAGEAEVHATGDAIMRNVRDVILGLRGAGVSVSLTGDLARTSWESL